MRVYDKKEKQWIKEGIYLDPNNDDLYIIEKGKFGKGKLKLVSSEKYIYHNDIRLNDKNGVLIHEGDIVEAEINPNEFIMTMVAWCPNIAAYALLDFETDTGYPLGKEQCKYIRIMGNIFDTPNVIEFDKEETNEKVSEKETTEETVNN